MENKADMDEKGSIQHVQTKKRGALQTIIVALFMLRHRSHKKSNSMRVDVPSKDQWKRVVSAIRPLHHERIQNHQQSPPPEVTSAPVTPLIKSLSHVGSSPSTSWASAASPTPSSSRSNDTRSLYSSTQNLQELDNSDGCTYKFVFEDEDEGENDNVNEDENGDQMIDVKAEEFIANFYEQMRIQQLDNTNEKIRKQ